MFGIFASNRDSKRGYFSWRNDWMFSPSSAAFDGASPEGDSRRAVVVANEEEV